MGGKLVGEKLYTQSQLKNLRQQVLRKFSFHPHSDRVTASDNESNGLLREHSSPLPTHTSLCVIECKV